ncbi:hypothetical protein M1146_06975, partial [Patescibacteria group bacterium]|nr:hypothetical protein [Patescibacteria group bacterium]
MFILLYQLSLYWRFYRYFFHFHGVHPFFFQHHEKFALIPLGTGIGLYYTQADWMQDALAFFIAFMYLVLSGLLSFFGWRLMTLISNTKTKVCLLSS